MSDDEWERWKAIYAERARPIPNVLRRARTDRARALGGMMFLYVIVILLALSAAAEVHRARSRLAGLPGWFSLATLGLLVVGAQIAMRGTIGRRDEPVDLLAGLERRHAGRRRLLRFMPWATGFMVVGMVGGAAASMVAAGAFDLGDALTTVVACGVAVWLIWAVMRRTSRLIDRELAEAAEARRLLEEGEAAPPNGR